MHLLIIGGSDAGISAARRAREVDPAVEVTVVVADAFPNYSICGLPFYLSGEVPDWQALAHRTVAEIEGQRISLLLNHRAQALDPSAKRAMVLDQRGQLHALAYDKLLIATGAEPVQPPIHGRDLPGVYFLHTMADSFRIHGRLSAEPPRHAVIVGGGYIGLEMADALTHRGVAVTLIQRGQSVLRTIEPGLSQLIEDELRRHGVDVVTGVAVEGIARHGSHLIVSAAPDVRRETDLVLLATGVRPVTEVARSAGVALGQQQAIRVTRAMETNIPDIFAAGDCVETWHRILHRPTYLPLGTTAHKQGRIAGENAVGGRAWYTGSLGTQVVKVFDLAIARTGLLESEARAAGFAATTTEATEWDHKAYYPGARPLTIRVTGDVDTRRLLGAQLLGHWQAEVAKRIDVFATALFHDMPVEQLSDLDLSYTPPVSSPWDPVQMAAQAWEAAHPRVAATLAARTDV